MKPSGIEWIGDIPDDWEVRRLKGLGEQTIGLTYSPQDITDNSGTLVLRSSNIQNGKLVLDRDDNVYVSIDVENKILKDEDILICSRNGSRNLVGKTAFVITYGKKLSYGAFTTIFRSKYNKFLFYVFNAGVFEYHLASYNTSTINQLTTSMLNEIRVPFPPVKTQQKIADYLDEKCGEIDATIAKQKEIIEKLKAYKQSLISETVTKGLDKSAPLKPSGIDYLGDIPSHWEIKKLKFLVSLIDNKTKDGHSISLENIESGTGKLIETENTYDGEGISFKENDLLFGKLRPYLAKVYLSALKGRALGDFYVMRANKGTNPNFLKFVLLSDWFIKIVDSSTYGTKMPRASWDFTGGMRIPLPPISEQDCISSYLEIKCSEVDTFIIEKQNIIQKLDAYKKSLIFECVTGKHYFI